MVQTGNLVVFTARTPKQKENCPHSKPLKVGSLSRSNKQFSWVVLGRGWLPYPTVPFTYVPLWNETEHNVLMTTRGTIVITIKFQNIGGLKKGHRQRACGPGKCGQ